MTINRLKDLIQDGKAKVTACKIDVDRKINIVVDGKCYSAKGEVANMVFLIINE